MVKAISFVAKSGTGKTTLLEQLIPEIKRRGIRLAVVKHDTHRFDIDHPGKDSHRLFSAGCDAVLISSPDKMALVRRHDEAPPIRQVIDHLFADMDLVITEGYKRGDLPKVELHRSERSPTLLCRGELHDPTLVAVVSDASWDLDVPVIPLTDVAAIADFLERWMGRVPS